MASYLLQKRKEDKALKKAKKTKPKAKRKDETAEERAARRERKRDKKARKASKRSTGLRAVEDLLQSWNSDPHIKTDQRRSASPKRARSPSPRSPRYSHSRDDRVRRGKAETRARSKTPSDHGSGRARHAGRYIDDRDGDQGRQDRHRASRTSRGQDRLDGGSFRQQVSRRDSVSPARSRD